MTCINCYQDDGKVDKMIDDWPFFVLIIVMIDH